MSIKPVAWGMPNSSITGRDQPLMMVRLEIPSDDQYGGKLWIPLSSAADASELAEALQEFVEAADSATQETFERSIKIATAKAISLLARITPK